ncbi:MAG: HD domain-containing phosphohydrolase [Leptospirales bacterium]
MKQNSNILVIDDNKSNIKIINTILGENYSLQNAETGEEGLARVLEFQTDLILLDVKMPGISGFEVAKQLKKNPSTSEIPVIFITALSDEASITKGFDLGGADYITKPFKEEELVCRVRTQLKLKYLIDNLDSMVKTKTRELKDLNTAFIMALERTNFYNDDITGSHIKRVCFYSKILCIGHDLPTEYTEQIFDYASMHDIGKVALPDSILKKPGQLTPEEMKVIQTHCEIGYKIINYPGIPDVAKNIVHYHHEKFDGTGYPIKMQGDDIPLESKIVALADVYDALRTRRPYKEPFSKVKAEEIIIELKGTHFDPKIVDVFFRNKEKFNAIHEDFLDES